MTMSTQDTILDNDLSVSTYDIDEQKIISVNKFIFLSIISFGLYELWWIYKEWRFFQQKEKSDITPAARAIFSIFYLHSLFSRILGFAKEKGYSGTYSATLLFIGYIVGSLLAQLPEPFWIVSLITLVFLIPPFKAMNFAKQNSTDFIVTEETSYSNRQIVLIIIGIVFWTLVLWGMTLTSE